MQRTMLIVPYMQYLIYYNYSKALIDLKTDMEYYKKPLSAAGWSQ